jgi:hypothetical protein
MEILHSHLGMLISMWVVMTLVGLTIIAKLIGQLRTATDWDAIARVISRPVLTDLFPLILLSMLTTLDGTHILVRIWFYAVAVAIVIRSLVALGRSIKK